MDLFLAKPLRQDAIPVLRAHAAAYAEQRAVEAAAASATREAARAAAAAAAGATVARTVLGPSGQRTGSSSPRCSTGSSGPLTPRSSDLESVAEESATAAGTDAED
jgi:hypothetical protein